MREESPVNPSQLEQFDDPPAGEPPTVAPVAEIVPAVPRLQYLHSYGFVFESRSWFANLMLATLFMFIPILGPIVLAGYQYDLVDAMHRRPKGTYPDVRFDRFGDYIGRGVWKFLVGMIVQMVMIPVYIMGYMIAMFLIILIGTAFSQNPGGAGPAIGIAAAVIVPLALAVLIGIAVALRFFTMPVVLKASLSGEGADLFDLNFLTDFIRRTWKEMLLELIWIYVTFPIVVIGGLLLCLVGMYPATAWVMMADAHTNWQLYEIYLARGGQPIRVKTAKPAPVVAVVDE